MALTINTQPSEIMYCNSALFDVTTNLTEGASFQNLRIKAELYYDGAVIASKTVRKGVSEFDFSDILRRLCQPFTYTLDESGEFYLPGAPAGGAPGTNLITSWDASLYPFDAFVSSGANISQMDETSDYAQAQSNTFTITAGKYYVVKINALTLDSGSLGFVAIGLNPAVVDHHLKMDMRDSESIYLFCAHTTTSSARVFLINPSGNAVNCSDCDVWVEELDAGPTMGAIFGIKFTEVYENASDVTTEGTPKYSDTYYFFDLEGDIDDYICDGNTKKMLVNWPEDPLDSDRPYFYLHDRNAEVAEIQVAFLSFYPRLQGNIDFSSAYRGIGDLGGIGSGLSASYNYFGYGLIIINNENASILSTMHELGIYISIYPNSTILNITHKIRRITRPLCENDIRLEWTNRQGGQVAYTFGGSKREAMVVEREVYRNSSKKRRTVSTTPSTIIDLETDYHEPGILRVIGEILESKNVYRHNYTGETYDTERVEVFVVSNRMMVYNDRALMSGEITIEE